MKLGDPIAPLRTDLEVQRRDDGTVDVRDPYLLQIFTIDAAEMDLARSFDGARSAKEIARSLPSVGGPRQVARIAEELRSLKLLDLPEVWQERPVLDNATPHTIILETNRKLKVLPEGEPGARWTCGACGACCHGLAVEVNTAEERRIDPSLYQDILRGRSFVEEAFIDPDRPAVRILRQDHDNGGACVFLGDDGLCAVHARQGMEAKPDACQIFPNMVIHLPKKGGARLAMRTNCRTMHESFETGQPVEEHREHVLRILQTSGSYLVPNKIDVFGEPWKFAQVDALRLRIDEVFDEHGVTNQAIRVLDKELFEGRVKAARKKYGKLMLKQVRAETDGDVAVEQGSLADYIDLAKRGRRALEAMKRGDKPPEVPKKVQTFLRVQMKNVLYAAGPMTFPDAGLGHVALLLAMEAALHAVGPRGSLKAANDAFIAFTMPVVETTAHAWPILDALDPDYADALREELEAWV